MSRMRLVNATLKQELIWRNIRIRKSLDDICYTLEAELNNSEREKIRKHDKIEVRFENTVVKDSADAGGRWVATVLIDEITAEADTTKHGLSIVGRSPARDIIDSAWSGSFDNFSLREVTRTIGKKFGITCDTFPTNKPDPTKTIKSFSWENESPWTKLIAEADAQGYILTSNEAGNLYLWPVASVMRSEGFHITEGVNLKTAHWTQNGAEQFHDYIIKGGGKSSSIIDPTCKTNRILTINMDDPNVTQEKLQRRAQTEMRRRKENRTKVTVSGWGLTDTQIEKLGAVTRGKEIFWIINSIIPVKIPSLALDDKLLISEVEHEAAAPDTFGTTLTLVNREAYT